MFFVNAFTCWIIAYESTLVTTLGSADEGRLLDAGAINGISEDNSLATLLHGYDCI